ncbi:MAG: type II toxin-antitoxin system HicB family antitoxin [Ignavibacteria bacterium]|nr:type II toxin-antitoxin system HicB family antitoxin [Ignavibacteria bacterium]
MKKIIHFTVSKGEKYYTAECVELAIITQGSTLDETASNIREATSLHFENEDYNDYGFIEDPAISVNFELSELEYA